MPGSVATFWSCSSEWSRTMSSTSASLANSLAGTRMSGRASAGISYSVSPTRTSSDIEDDTGVPAISLALEPEAMVRDGLHERPRRAAAADDDGAELAAAERE